ncbi:GGDEF domain-containing protein [Cryptosporangium minutisporangium]|uniref:GGDEF domain-containing protein n=1 Tax=Cryptosporangium minutisporangium TaxID=113569 RepID=UPI0035E8DFEF
MSIVARLLGLTMAAAAVPLAADTWSNDIPPTIVPIGPLCLIACVLGAAALRTTSERRYRRLNAAQCALDVAAALAAVLSVPTLGQDLSVALLVLPAMWASVRFGLGPRATVIAWLATVLAYAAVLALGLDPWDQDLASSGPMDRSALLYFAPAAALGLLAAWTTGSQTRAVTRHLATVEQARAVLQHQATHDSLTGVANRTALRHGVAATTSAGAVMVIDLDGFKAVNDTYGHAAGDWILQSVAARLTRAIRPGDVAVRVGGDEFVLVLPHADEQTTADLATRLQLSLCEPVLTPEGLLSVGASIGTAVTIDRGDVWDLDQMLAQADASMYAAKSERARRRQPVLTACESRPGVRALA